MLSFFLWTDWTIFPVASAGDEIDRPSRRVGSEPARGFFCLERW
jgi:hypothetical protein